jgi:hypothetical protein
MTACELSQDKGEKFKVDFGLLRAISLLVGSCTIKVSGGGRWRQCFCKGLTDFA